MASLRTTQQRTRYARTNGDLLVNAPIGAGIPSGQEPIVWWWGSDTPWHSASSAPGLAAVTRATSLIVNTLSAAPWRQLAGGDTPGTPTVELGLPRWLADPMLFRPDGRFGESPAVAAVRLPRASFWSQWIRSCLWRGMGYLIFEEGLEGAPMPGTLRVLNPDVVSPQDAPFISRRIGSEQGGGLAVDTDPDGRVQLGPRTYRLVELKNPLMQADYLGVTEGVLTAHARELGLASQAADYGVGMLRSGVPAGYLKTTNNLNAEQAGKLRDSWLAYHGGDSRSIAVLSASVDFTPIQMSPLDLALIETRKMALADIANAFGVPLYMLNGGEPGGGMTYSNAESRSLDFRSYTLLPWANAVEDVLSSLLPQGRVVEVDFRGILRADTATRYAAYTEALAGGWLTVAEIREREGLGPLAAPDPLQTLMNEMSADPAPQEVPA